MARDLRDILFRIPAVARQAMAIIRRENPDVILAIGDDGVFLLGAFLAARKTGRPLVVFLLDIYAGNNYSALKRGLARLTEPRILRYATRLLVTNENTRSHYMMRYGQESIVIHHPVPATEHIVARDAEKPATLVYTGTVYWAQLDSLQNLVSALKRVPEVRLELVSETPAAELQAMGLRGPGVIYRPLTTEQAQQRQRLADILFLPLAFHSRAPDVIRTAFPGKLAEYLAAGVPILVHAPRDSYVAADAERNGWGVVVDEPDVQLLADAVKLLLSDMNLRARLVRSAFDLVLARHRESTVQELFRASLQVASQRRPVSPASG